MSPENTSRPDPAHTQPGDRGQRRRRPRKARRDSNFVDVASQVTRTREVLERFDADAVEQHDREWLKRELALLEQELKRVLA